MPRENFKSVTLRETTVKYTVFVDDNFHIGDEEERHKLGEYDSCREAVAACKEIVNDFLNKGYREGMSFKELWEG
jgi:hypothetical protein